MEKKHNYSLSVKWTGNTGTGTSDYREYERSHTIRISGKPEILASSDAPFRGDKTKPNPEDFLLASLSSCHMLWYLHVCADAGVVVTDYSDEATGVLLIPEQGPGHFAEVTLHPAVTVSDNSMIEKAEALHTKAHELCFMANSVNFPVHHRASVQVADTGK